MTALLNPLARIALFGGFLAGIIAPGPVAAQQQVGVDSAVNREATGTPPNTPPRQLMIGQPIIFDEHITTDEAGQTQILFIDESSIGIGPNSDLVIDRFVYNPSLGAGGMTASLARGVFRYIGGKLSKEPNAVSLTTPAATIGIRGAVILVDVIPDGRTEVIFAYGRGVTVTGRNGVAATILRPGYEVVVARPGASPSAPFPAPSEATARLLAALDGRPGAHGGAVVIPTDATVARSRISRDISADLAAGIAAAQSTRPPAPPVFDLTRRLDRLQLNTAAAQGIEATPLAPPAGVPPGVRLLGGNVGQFIDTPEGGAARSLAGRGVP